MSEEEAVQLLFEYMISLKRRQKVVVGPCAEEELMQEAIAFVRKYYEELE